MKPLVLREIADELGLHESTISRVTTAKYMATPLGTFELNISSAVARHRGRRATRRAPRFARLLGQPVAAEDPGNPLDSQLSQMLDEQGIQVARRTVAGTARR